MDFLRAKMMAADLVSTMAEWWVLGSAVLMAAQKVVLQVEVRVDVAVFELVEQLVFLKVGWLVV
jgi:hypothetical protein